MTPTIRQKLITLQWWAWLYSAAFMRFCLEVGTEEVTRFRQALRHIDADVIDEMYTGVWLEIAKIQRVKYVI